MDLTHILAFLGTLLGSFLAQAAHDRAKDNQQDKAIKALEDRCRANHPDPIQIRHGTME